ncbi:hypothetical protein MHYP_G00196020 [Metynnis hypsauchen]
MWSDELSEIPAVHEWLRKASKPGQSLMCYFRGDEMKAAIMDAMDSSPAYVVCSLLNSRHRTGHLEKLVDLEGFCPEEHCWVPTADILDHSLIEKFLCPKPRSRLSVNSVPGKFRSGHQWSSCPEF